MNLNEEQILKFASELSLSKHTVPKDDRKNLFSYDQLAKDYWWDIWKKAKEAFKTSFDLENNDPFKDENPRIITIKRKSKDKVDEDSEEIFQVRCQLWYAGGDWECPNMYFKCQCVENSFYGLGSIKTYLGDLNTYGSAHLILIPPKEAGNNNLIQSSKDGSWVALQDDKSSKDLDPKKAWAWVEQYFLKMVIDHTKGKNIDKKAAFDVTIGEDGLKNSWQAPFPETTKCCDCGDEARIGFVVFEKPANSTGHNTTFKCLPTYSIDNVEPKEQFVCDIHNNDSENYWLHDCCAVAIYFCKKCLNPTAISNQG